MTTAVWTWKQRDGELLLSLQFGCIMYLNLDSEAAQHTVTIVSQSVIGGVCIVGMEGDTTVNYCRKYNSYTASLKNLDIMEGV